MKILWPTHRIPLWFLCGPPVLLLAYFIYASFVVLQAPFSLDPGEGNLLASLQILQRHGTLYTDTQTYPLVYNAYPPVFFILAYPGFAWLGMGLAATRAVSIASALAIVGLVYLILRRHELAPSAALAGAAAVVALPIVQNWAPLGRVDMLAIALTLGGWIAADRWLDGNAHSPQAPATAHPMSTWARLPWLSAAAFALAAFTRQTALLAPFCYVVSLATQGNRRRDAVVLGATCAAAIIGLAPMPVP